MSRKRGGVEIGVTAGLLAVALAATASAQTPGPTGIPDGLTYDAAVACAALFRIVDPEGSDLERRTSRFEDWARQLGGGHDPGADVSEKQAGLIAATHTGQAISQADQARMLHAGLADRCAGYWLAHGRRVESEWMLTRSADLVEQ